MTAPMETGTPMRNFGRRSILTGTIVASPLRKSLASGSSAALLKPVDDEQERSKRRSIIETQRRLTNITGSSQSPLVDTSLLDEAQIQDHLKICVKLYTENRISAKNAWQLHVIDAIRKISSVGSSNVLQVAGSSLDIGAKVYSLRVDDVHAKGLQLASSMSKSNEKQQTVQENDEEALQDVTTQRRELRRKRIKKLAHDKRNTVDTEGKTLTTSIELIELPVFATKENIDVGATDNLFTHKLPTDPSSHEVITMSAEKYWSLGPDDILNTHNKEVQGLPQLLHYNLCVPLKDFDTGAWDPEEERLLAEQSILPPVVLDDNGVPIADLDGSINDIFQDDEIAEDLHSDVEQHEEEFHAQFHGKIGHIIDALPEEARIETDYGFNVLVKTSSGKYIDKIWAGPCHWKVKFNRRSTPRYSGTSTQEVVKQPRKKKLAVPIDFSIENDEDISKRFGKFSVKRGSQSQNSEKISLPTPDFELSLGFFNKFIDELIIKPGVRRPGINNNIKTQQDYEAQECNYDNLNEHCSRHSDIEDNGEPAGDHSFEDVEVAAQEQLLDENFSSEPETAAPITFAKHAKKMDMKKLKSAIWNCLGQESEQQRIVNFKPTKFSTLYQDLPCLLPTDMKKELTCPLAVVALLHLCNENNLILQADGDHKDFSINKAEE